MFEIDSPASVRELYIRYGVIEDNNDDEVRSCAEMEEESEEDGKKKVDAENISNSRIKSSENTIVLEEVDGLSDIESEDSFDTNQDTALEPPEITESQDLSEFDDEEPRREISQSNGNIFEAPDAQEVPAGGNERSEEAEREIRNSREDHGVDGEIELLKIVSVETLEAKDVKVENPSPGGGSKDSDKTLDCIDSVTPVASCKKTIECVHCSKRFSKARKYSSHLARRHGEYQDYQITRESPVGLKLKVRKTGGELRCRKCLVERSFSSRRLLYTHYSIRHYQEELEDKLGTTDGICPLACGVARKRNLQDLVAHLGSEHSWVEEFMPVAWRVDSLVSRPDITEQSQVESETSPGSESELSEWSTTSSTRGTPRNQSISSPSLPPPVVTNTDTESLLYQREFTITSDTLCAVANCGYEARSKAALYEHYSCVHFKAELCQMMGYTRPTECPLCEFQRSGPTSVVRHYGTVHRMVEPFIPSFRLHRCDVRIKNEKIQLERSEEKLSISDNEERNYKELLWSCQLCSSQSFRKKSSFLNHLAGVHFKEELRQKLGDPTCSRCPECGKEMKTTELIRHVGVSHRYLEQITPWPEKLGRNYKRKRFSREDEAFEYESPIPTRKKLKKSESEEEKTGGLWRCHLCKSKPFVSKSRLYYHQSLVHFKENLLEMLDDPSKCPECGKTMNTCDLVRHLGVTHSYLERFILKPPAENTRQAEGKQEEREKSSFLEADEEDGELNKDDQSSGGKRITLTHQHKYLDTEDSATFLCHICYSQHNKMKTFHLKGKLYEHYSTVHYKSALEEMFGISKEDTICPDCQQTKHRLLTHLGVTHNHVERFLPSMYQGNTTTKQAVTDIIGEMIATATSNDDHVVRPIIEQILEQVVDN